MSEEKSLMETMLEHGVEWSDLDEESKDELIAEIIKKLKDIE